MRIQVKDFMSASIVITESGSSVVNIRELMQQKDIRAIPVVKLQDEKTDVVGIVTVEELSNLTDESVPVDDIMCRNFFKVNKNTSAQAAAEAMLKRKARHLIVMDKGKVAGILCFKDFVRLIAEKKSISFSTIMFW